MPILPFNPQTLFSVQPGQPVNALHGVPVTPQQSRQQAQCMGTAEAAIRAIGAADADDFDPLQVGNIVGSIGNSDDADETASPKRQRVSATIASTLDGLASLDHDLAFEDSTLNLGDENTPGKDSV
jgi:hypothetical protein